MQVWGWDWCRGLGKWGCHCPGAVASSRLIKSPLFPSLKIKPLHHWDVPLPSCVLGSPGFCQVPLPGLGWVTELALLPAG